MIEDPRDEKDGAPEDAADSPEGGAAQPGKPGSAPDDADMWASPPEEEGETGTEDGAEPAPAEGEAADPFAADVPEAGGEQECAESPESASDDPWGAAGGDDEAQAEDTAPDDTADDEPAPEELASIPEMIDAIAGTNRPGLHGKWRQEMAAEPWRYDFYGVMRHLEQSHGDKPRIGEAQTTRDEILNIGQEPFMRFAPANIAKVGTVVNGRLQVLVRFMGMLGPMGPLPMTTTEEAYNWYLRRDDSFSRFLDIFNDRFIKLFYRAHAQSRPASHFVREDEDRFGDFLGSAAGIGGETWRDLDTLPDITKLQFAGLLGPRQMNASRLQSFLEGMFGLGAEVDEFVGSYLELAPEHCSRLGDPDAALGGGVMLGARVISVDHKVRIRLNVSSLEMYERFLPGGDWGKLLLDTMFNALGEEYDWDVELVMPTRCVKPTQLGSFGRVGLTTWMRSQNEVADEGVVRTRFSPAAIHGAAVA